MCSSDACGHGSLCCRCFGYVNYYTEEAERAASLKQGYKISGVAIKTKGPKLLSHQIPLPPGQMDILLPQSTSGLSLHDCSFFITGKKGKKCKKAGSVNIGHTMHIRD